MDAAPHRSAALNAVAWPNMNMQAFETDRKGPMVSISISSLLHNTTPSFVSASVQCDSCLFPVDCQPLVAVWIKKTLYGITSYCSKCVLVEQGPSSVSSSHYSSNRCLRLKKMCSVSWYWWTLDVKVVVISFWPLRGRKTF